MSAKLWPTSPRPRPTRGCWICRYGPQSVTPRPVLPAISVLTCRVDRCSGDATFVLRWRDPAGVAHAGGLHQVMPVGVFQPSVGGAAAYRSLTTVRPDEQLIRAYFLGLGVDPLTFTTDMSVVAAIDAAVFGGLTLCDS